MCAPKAWCRGCDKWMRCTIEVQGFEKKDQCCSTLVKLCCTCRMDEKFAAHPTIGSAHDGCGGAVAEIISPVAETKSTMTDVAAQVHRHPHPSCPTCTERYCPDMKMEFCGVCRKYCHAIKEKKPAPRLCGSCGMIECKMCCSCSAKFASVSILPPMPRRRVEEKPCVVCHKMVCLLHSVGKLDKYRCKGCVLPEEEEVDYSIVNSLWL